MIISKKQYVDDRVLLKFFIPFFRTIAISLIATHKTNNMNTNKILATGLVGGVVAFILGFLIWGIALSGVMESNAGSATGVMRSEADFMWIPMILGHLSWGILFAYIYGHWANIKTFATGAKGGATLGFLIGFTYDMINLGSTNIINTTGAIINVVAMTIVSAIVGGAVGWMLGRGAD